MYVLGPARAPTAASCVKYFSVIETGLFAASLFQYVNPHGENTISGGPERLERRLTTSSRPRRPNTHTR